MPPGQKAPTAGWCAASSPVTPPALVSVIPKGNVSRNPDIAGGDDQYSLLINGRSYWSFDDTPLKHANAAGLTMPDNTLSWATSLNAANGITLDGAQADSSGYPERYIPFTADEQAFQTAHNANACTATPCGDNLGIWPGPIVYNPSSRQVIVPFVEIRRNPAVPGWTTVGGGLAVGQVNADGSGFTMTRPTQSSSTSTPTLMWMSTDQIFTDQAFMVGNMYYAYGTRSSFVTSQVVLARVPVSMILNRSAWTYYAGNETWSGNPSDATTLFAGSAAGSSIYFNQYLHVWMAVYCGNFTSNIYYRAAYSPEGPWSDQALLFAGTNGYNNTPNYACRVHPEFSPDGGRTEYVTSVTDTGPVFGQQLPTLQVIFNSSSP